MRFSAISWVLLGAAGCLAQDVKVYGGAYEDVPVFKSVNTSMIEKDRPAVWGESKMYYNRGIGIYGTGNFIGVKGVSEGSGGVHYGVAGIATNGAGNYGVYAYAPPGTNSYAAYINGNMLMAGNTTYLSDARLKTNITAMGSSLDRLMTLKPKTYQMLASALAPESKSFGLAQGTQNGLLAQDVQIVFPELVSDVPVVDPTANTKKGAAVVSYKGVNYIGLVPVLIKAIQEQQAQIQTLQDQVLALKKSK